MNMISSLKKRKKLIFTSLMALVLNVNGIASSAFALSDNSTARKAKDIIKSVVESNVLEKSFPQEQINLKKTFIENKIDNRFEEIQDALCNDYTEWVIDNPDDNRIGHNENFSNCFVRLYSVERQTQTGSIEKLFETYLLTVKINRDHNKILSASIDDVQTFQYDFNPNQFHNQGQKLESTGYVCRFDRIDFDDSKGIKIPLLNTKIQYKKVEGPVEKAITVETDGKIITAISVVVREYGKIKYLDLLNKEEVLTRLGLSGNGHLVVSDFNPNRGTAGSPPRPVPELLNCYSLDNGSPANMRR
ncbi:MAG: hypothetical protein ACXVCP_18615 [Bdellovibrio sp.]